MTSTAFKQLDASEEALESGSGVTEIDSVCMNCYETGHTKLLLTRIPFYRDVIISSFSCDHCHTQNNGVESANKIQDRGVRYKLEVKDQKDLNREMVKSDHALLQIPAIDFEIPSHTQKGCKKIFNKPQKMNHLFHENFF
jgi:zinc finger protein